MFSAVASGIFAYRNADKAQNGEIGRSAVTLGQTAGLVQEVAKYDGIAANTARSALSVFSDLAKQNKAFEYAGKATQFAINNVNPLICASGVIKTVMSDDKVGTGITEVAALSAMFAGEGMIKKYYDDVASSNAVQKTLENMSENRALKPIFDYLEKHNLKGKAGAIIKGLLFVTGSMTSYSVGQELSKPLVKRAKSDLGIVEKNENKDGKKINRMT